MVLFIVFIARLLNPLDIIFAVIATSYCRSWWQFVATAA
jgi:hypothetical protein